MVAAPVAVGCYAWYRRPQERFGVLLVAAGYGWFLTTLAESDVALLYSVGRIAGWFVELQLVYLTLSFPTGRLSGRIDRALVGSRRRDGGAALPPECAPGRSLPAAGAVHQLRQ